MIERLDLAARASHLRSLLFTEWAVLGLAAAALVWIGNRRLASARAREHLLVGASLALLAWFASLPVAAAWLAYGVGFHAAVERVRPRALAVALVVALLAALVVLPIVLIDPLGARGGHVRHFTAFATNMALLRFYAYAVDRWRGRAGPEPLRGFLLAMFFFPTFVNGPIETPRDMRAGWLPPAPDAQRAGAGGGLGRVAGGVAKLLVAGLAFPPGWTSSALGAGAAAPAGQLWLWGALLYGWFYLSFAAWTDVAVGLGRLCGRRVQENFAHPWAAVDPADFWRRWHLSFGLWLRDYVYIPLGGNRRRRALNVLATFLVSAAWHIWGSVKFLGLGFFGPHAWEGFLFWGLLNAAGVLAARPMARAVRAGGAWGVGVGRVATFAFAAWCWIPFFLPPGVAARDCLAMLRRMVWPF